MVADSITRLNGGHDYAFHFADGGNGYYFSDGSYGRYDKDGNGYYIWDRHGAPGDIIGQTTYGTSIIQGPIGPQYGTMTGFEGAYGYVHDSNTQPFDGVSFSVNNGGGPNYNTGVQNIWPTSDEGATRFGGGHYIDEGGGISHH
jgi:hypothetical protein